MKNEQNNNHGHRQGPSGYNRKNMHLPCRNDINVLDINQSIVQGFFNMIMIVDAQNARKDFAVLNEEIEKISEELGVKIKMQHEDIFNVMHRI